MFTVAAAFLTYPYAWYTSVGIRSRPILKCCRLRSVCAPQYRSAGTSTSPRLSNSRRIPVASSPMVRSRIFGASSFVAVMVRALLKAGRGSFSGDSRLVARRDAARA